MSSSAPLGFDLGTATSKIAVARNRGIDVLANEASSRLTPSLVGFGARSRSLGESALTQQSSNFKNTVGSLRRLIGRSFADPEVQSHESKFLNAEMVDVKGQVGFRVNYLGEQQVFSVTQVYAMLLGKLRDTAAAELKSPVNTAVITVPGWYTDTQRRAVLDAAEIAGLRVPRLVNDTTASAIGYGIVRSDLPEVGETPRKVVFCDIGHSDYSVSIVAFNKGKMSVLATAHDRNFGGRDLDLALVEHFATEFKDKYKIDVRSNKKATFRLAVAVEKLKKILSANAQAPLNVESIMNDIDASSSLTRETFEELIQPLLDRTTQPLERALQQAGLAAADVDSIELLGGSCRVPGIRSRIQQFFGKPLSATLNSEEAIARGATFICATLSPGFRVREMETLDVCPYAVEIAWERAPEDTADEGTSLVMFPPGSSFPSAKIVRLRRSEAFDLEARYADPSAVPAGSSWIGRCTVKNVRKALDGSPADIKVRARINDSGLFQFDSTATMSEYAAEAEAEAEAPADAQPEANGDATAAPAKKARKVTKTDLPVIFYSASLDQSTLEDYRAKEGDMAASDRLVSETENAKNALEEYIYDMRSKIDSGGSLAAFASSSEKDALREKLSAAEEWLYDEGDDASKSAYVTRLDELKKLGDPVVFRSREHDDRPRAIKALRETLADLQSKVTGQDERYAHLSDSDRETVIKHVADHESWINNQVARQAERARHENAVLSTAEIEKRRQQALYDCTPIVTKVKPAVPSAAKETKKEPEPAAAPADAEMADATEPAAEATEIDID